MRNQGPRKLGFFFVMGAVLPLLFTLFLPCSYAVVGRAVGFKDFDEKDLAEFQNKLLDEQRLQKMDHYDDISRILSQRSGEIGGLEGDVEAALKRDIEILKMQLLSLPKRDRVRYELRGSHKYDSNISRAVPRSEKGDSVFNEDSFLLLDLSGKKTDFRFDLGYRRQWNIVFSEKDEWQMEERLRFRRKYFKKVSVSSNSRIARNNTKTIEIDANKIRWDLDNQIAINFPFSRKLSLNMDTSGQKRYFPQEAFDQDSNHQVQFAPSGFWDITPKSRIQAGYRFGASRIRTKTGDTNTHDYAFGYFGRLTKKSSVSFNGTYNIQVPRSRDTAEVKTWTVGTGHIWQLTPKTQLSSQVTRSMQNTTSTLTSGEVDGINTATRTDTRITTDNLSFSVNSRLMRKLTAVLTLAMTHSRTKTTRSIEDALQDFTQARTFTFPSSFSLNYALRRWVTLSWGYSFGFRTGNEKSETNRAHTWTSDIRMLF